MKSVFKLIPLVLVLIISTQCDLHAQTGIKSSDKETALPDGKVISTPAAARLNSFPVAFAVSPDGHYVVALNNGFGTAESGSNQSLAVLDRVTNVVTDYPDDRLAEKARQTYFLG